MISELTNVKIFLNLLILPAGFPGAFCIRRLDPLARGALI